MQYPRTQGGENTVEAGAGLHNALGRAEHLVATFEYGTESSSQASVSYEQPRILGLPLVVGAGGLASGLALRSEPRLLLAAEGQTTICK